MVLFVVIFVPKIPCYHSTTRSLAFTPIAVILCDKGAAIGPQLAGILSRSSWHHVFYMLIAAEFVALLVSTFSEWISAH